MKTRTKERPLVFISGPLFNEGERWFNDQIDSLLRKCGYETFLPQRDASELSYPLGITKIFQADKNAIDRCDFVIAVLNGATVDEGADLVQ